MPSLQSMIPTSKENAVKLLTEWKEAGTPLWPLSWPQRQHFPDRAFSEHASAKVTDVDWEKVTLLISEDFYIDVQVHIGSKSIACRAKQDVTAPFEVRLDGDGVEFGTQGPLEGFLQAVWIIQPEQTVDCLIQVSRNSRVSAV